MCLVFLLDVGFHQLNSSGSYLPYLKLGIQRQMRPECYVGAGGGFILPMLLEVFLLESGVALQVGVKKAL